MIVGTPNVKMLDKFIYLKNALKNSILPKWTDECCINVMLTFNL